MSATHIEHAAAPFVEIVRNVKPDQLAVPPPAASESDVDLAGPDWATALEAHAARIVATWGEPGAWAGVTRPSARTGTRTCCGTCTTRWPAAPSRVDS